MLLIESEIFFSQHINTRIKRQNSETHLGGIHLQSLSLLQFQICDKFLNKILIFQLSGTHHKFNVEEEQKGCTQRCYEALLSIVCEFLSVQSSVFKTDKFGKPSLVTFCCDASVIEFASCEVG